MGIFLNYLQVGIGMTPLLLLGLLLLPRLSKRYTAKAAYFVWLVIAARLLLPWNLTLPQGAAPLHFEWEQKETQWVPAELMAEEKEGIHPVAEKGEAASPEVVPAATENGSERKFLFWLWGIGMVFSFGYPILATAQLHRMLCRWEKAPQEKTLRIYRKISGEKAPMLRISPAAETPLTVGFFRTKLYLPHEDYEQQELEMIFCHELTHWHRRDLWYKGILLLARSIHWYHPLVWCGVKRAKRDLEISCDSLVVQGRDEHYRKEYSLMLLREAEHHLQRQGALTTCFTEGKRVLQERLVEILNGKKRKRGILLVALTLVMALSCGCLVSYGEEKNVESGNEMLTAEQRKIVDIWAKALSQRDGRLRYDYMGQEAKAQFSEEQRAIQGEEWDFDIGGSSPWVVSYEVEESKDRAVITYYLEDSIPQKYTQKELLHFGEEKGKVVVKSYQTSSLYWEDGKIVPTIYKSGAALEEGLWDFLWQSTVGFFQQSEYQERLWESFSFILEDMTVERMGDGMDHITVPFVLEMTYVEPDGEIGRERTSREEMRFSCILAPDAEEINETTCDPAHFWLEVKTKEHPLQEGDGEYIQAYEKYYDSVPKSGWFCTMRMDISGTKPMVIRNILIPDTTGRTEYGFFLFHVGTYGGFRLAEDLVVTVGDSPETLRQMNREEWLAWGKERREAPLGYTIEGRQEKTGEFLITALRKGYWKEEEVSSKNLDSSIPSGYPTESRTVTRPFVMQDAAYRHTGIDLSTDGAEAPVHATADGMVMDAGFTAERGNYVLLNHGNGFTTLYAHLSEIETAVGERVQQGAVIGQSGRSGRATGIHCHYEIQLNGMYQDPMQYTER